MAIYVDSLDFHKSGPLRAIGARTRWCHMMTDGALDELHAFAEGIGLRRSAFQPHRSHPHYDLTASRRAWALANGAVAVTSAELLQRCSLPHQAGSKTTA